MDLLTFISELVNATAWPITIVIPAFLLRKPVIELIPLLRKLKYKELQLEFSKEVSDLKTHAETITKGRGENATADLTGLSHLLKLVTYSTRAAILEAWLELESAALAVATCFWQPSNGNAFHKIPELGTYLLQCDVIDEEQLKILNKLYQLKNQAAHAKDLELLEQDAESYVQLALDLIAQIKSKKPGLIT